MPYYFINQLVLVHHAPQCCIQWLAVLFHGVEVKRHRWMRVLASVDLFSCLSKLILAGFHANSAFYPHLDGKWVPAKARRRSAAGEYI